LERRSRLTTGTQELSGADQFSKLAGGIGIVAHLIRSAFLGSDRRLKDDISQVGSLFDGTPVYGRYKGAPAITSA
jgi:hypothetical protein